MRAAIVLTRANGSWRVPCAGATRLPPRAAIGFSSTSRPWSWKPAGPFLPRSLDPPAERRDPECEQAYDKIATRHRGAIDDLLGRQSRRVRALVDEQLGELHDALHGIRLLGHCPPAALDVAASFGERLSALIVSAYLNRFRRTRFVDARGFVTTV